MQIVMATGAMNFGPHTLTYKSLGGSETAALMLGKALAARGHQVTHFCNLPAPGQPDFVQPGMADDGVVYAPIQAYEQYALVNECDLLIATRDPRLVAMPTQARKKVLWMHDIAVKRGMGKALEQMEFTFDEIWCVSEWHRKQINEAIGYPLKNIVALRNGIVPIDTIQSCRLDNVLLYAARPERGLDNLIKPGGIMDHLPEFKLRVAMYDHFPEHMRSYYEMIFARMKAMPNVEYIGSKTQQELRQEMADATAYIYPTQFEETSCIIARECIEQCLPFLTTKEGALPETLGDCGIFFEEFCEEIAQAWHAARFPNDNNTPFVVPEKGSPEWCALFAEFTRNALKANVLLGSKNRNMLDRNDLYWDGVAEMVEENAEPKAATLFSQLYSLMMDGDVMPAKALLDNYDGEFSPALDAIADELHTMYRFTESEEAMAAYYERIYASKKDTPEGECTFRVDGLLSPRGQAIAQEIAKLPAGSNVFEYGCGAGHVLAPLAKMFPNINFLGCDYSETAVNVIFTGAAEHELPNLRAFVNDGPVKLDIPVDAVICTEVLEHAIKPWELLQTVEALVKPGGRVITTVPFGAWEPISFLRQGHWWERAHIWLIDKATFREMAGEKPNESWLGISVTEDAWKRPIGNLVFAYDADHRPIQPINALAKARRHFARNTTAAAVIAYNNEDTILRMLNSIDQKVQFVQIAMGPSTDNTLEIVQRWFEERQWMYYNIIDVPKIEPWKFGFDDARNASVRGLKRDFPWVLWIDTDEYLSGDFRPYLRNNALNAYLIPQHHFTVEPRGRGAEIDRPARLFRGDGDFIAKGHIHEHFEVPEGGPGRCFLLPNIDIGHTGYVNEQVRKGRFDRNFPFLQWDHETNPDRKLHKFLWFRDRVHLCRFERQRGNIEKAVELAKEAKAYYYAHQSEMSAFGPGMFYALAHMAEINELLGVGVPMEITVKFDDRSAVLQSRFENYSHAESVFKQLLEPEFKERTSRYY